MSDLSMADFALGCGDSLRYPTPEEWAKILWESSESVRMVLQYLPPLRVNPINKLVIDQIPELRDCRYKQRVLIADHTAVFYWTERGWLVVETSLDGDGIVRSSWYHGDELVDLFHDERFGTDLPFRLINAMTQLVLDEKKAIEDRLTPFNVASRRLGFLNDRLQYLPDKSRA